MKIDITAGRWRVPDDLTGSDTWANGVTVLTQGRLVADCRGQVPEAEQRANARAIAAVPAMLELLHEAEIYLGDQPNTDRAAMRLHRHIVAMLGGGLR
jgi:hypothetical protein